MKKIMAIIPLIFAVATISAQIPNSDMELWTSAPTLVGWQTNSNPLTLPPYDPYVVRRDSDSYSGLWAADYYGNGVFKPWGIAVFPVSQHPVALSLYYKLLFAPCVNQIGGSIFDTASLSVELMDHGAVVDRGYWQSTTLQSRYSQLVIPFSQNATVFDSCRITVTGGSVSTGCVGAIWHTEFKVDHMQMLYSTGQSCIDSSSICNNCICPLYFYPVCGCNGVTYSNTCFAQSAGVLYWTSGSCPNTGSCSAFYNYTADSTGLGVNFTDASVGSYDSLRWDFGDTTSVTTGLVPSYHSYSSSGIYTVCLTIFSASLSCSNTYCQTVVIAPPGPCPDASLVQQGYQCGTTYDPVCGCDGVTYSNSCEAFYHHGVSSFTPGSCRAPVLCYANYFYQLDSSGYMASFQYSGGLNTGAPTNPNVSLLWRFGDGSTDTGMYPVHTFTDTSVHSWWVCLTVHDSIDSCTSIWCDSVSVGPIVPGCYAGFGYNMDSGGVVTVYPADSANGALNSSGAWTIGNNNIGTPPSFVLDSTSHFDICHTVSNGATHCSDTICVNAHQIYLASHRPAGLREVPGDPLQMDLYPNPAANTVRLQVMSSATGQADITILNMLGEEVYRLPGLRMGAGVSAYTLDLTGLSSGVYFVQFRINDHQAGVRKLVKM